MSHVARVGPSRSTVNPSTPLGAGGFGCGKLSNDRRRVRPGARARHELLDVSLALVARGVKKLQVVLRRQERRQQANRGEVDRCRRRAARESPGTCVRPAPPRCGDTPRAPTGGAPAAIGEERRAAFSEIEAPRVELHQERDELRGRVTLARGRAVNLRQQIAIGQSADGRDVDHHPAHIPSSFSTPGTARHRAIVVRDTISAASLARTCD